MLNEMMLLRRTLADLGISTTSRHPDISPLAKSSPLLRVFLNAQGNVASVEVVPQDVAPSYWTFRDGKQNSFPRISFKPALRPGATSEQLEVLSNKRKSVEQKRAAYLALLESLPIRNEGVIPWTTPGHRQRIAERGADVDKSGHTEARIFCDLVNAFISTEDGTLLAQIETAVVSELDANPSEELLALAVRLSFRDGAKSEKPGDACDLLFDFRDAKTFNCAAEPGMSMILSRALPAKAAGGAPGVCALTGESAIIESDKFPEANLPVLGPSVIHTRNPDLPSGHRYGASGPDSMPIGSALASELQSAAEELTKPERKGKTWTSIPSEKGDKGDLLICYLAGLPDLELADAITVSEAGFEALGERIVELAKGKSMGIPANARIDVTVFRAIDKANKKTVHSSSLTRQGLENAARDWTLACRNVPDIMLFVPNKKGEAATQVRPRTLTPGSIVALSKKVYMTAGTKSAQAAGLSFAEAFGLVLRGKANSPAKIRSLIGFVLARFTPLLVGVGHVKSRLIKSSSKPDMDAFSPEARKDALDAISLLGALLFQLDIKITKDMNTPAYLLGQLLAGSDVLHRGYCLAVRGGKLPPKLIGNATMNTAAKNPSAALAQLLQRWGPYDGWAKKWLAETNFEALRARHEGDKQKTSAIYDIRDAAFAPGNLREIAKQLAAPDAFGRPDDTFRSQLFLGYLAGLPRTSEREKPASITTPPTTNS
jgi:hypothetical protein